MSEDETRCSYYGLRIAATLLFSKLKMNTTTNSSYYFTTNRSDAYKQQSLRLLVSEFPQISQDAIQAVQQETEYDFRASFQYMLLLEEARMYGDESDLPGFLVSIRPVFVPPSNRRYWRRNRRFMEPQLREEMTSLLEFLAEQKTVVDYSGMMGLADDDIFTCECCFNDATSADQVGQCTEGHIFCISCITQYANEQVYGSNKSILKCMSSEGCNAGYPKITVDKLPENIVQALVAAEHRESVEAAIIPDMQKCPKCAYLFQCEVARIQFPTCPNLECQHGFCLLCDLTPHQHQTCEEALAENDRALTINTAAEAMTTAVKRVCPNPTCKLEFVKASGCNKITCSRCRTRSCYCCRMELRDNAPYTHFCQAAHCDHSRCGKCSLYTNSEAEDNAARRRAGEALYDVTDSETAAAVQSLLRI